MLHTEHEFHEIIYTDQKIKCKSYQIFNLNCIDINNKIQDYKK